MEKNISNLSTTLSVVPDFSEDARNMVGLRTVSVVRVFGQCSENTKLQYIWIAEFRDTATIDQILIGGDRMYFNTLKKKQYHVKNT